MRAPGVALGHGVDGYELCVREADAQHADVRGQIPDVGHQSLFPEIRLRPQCLVSGAKKGLVVHPVRHIPAQQHGGAA